MLFPGVLLPFWTTRVSTIKNQVKFISESLNQEILSGIESKANLLAPLNSSATDLTRIVKSSLNETELSFPIIESKVAPLLFEAFSTIPYLTQVSFIGLDGLLFSYYKKGNQQPIAVYSNSTVIKQNATTKDTWYSQPVNPDTGKRYGEAITNASWGQLALKITKGYASLGTAWSDGEDLLFLNRVDVFGKGSISLGYQVKSVVKLFSGIHGNGGSLYLATKEGKNAVSEGMIPNTRMVIDGNSVAFQLLNSSGDQIGQVGNLTCQPNDGNLRAQFLNIWETIYMLYCSPLKVVGVELVYVLAIPHKGSLESLVHNNFKIALVLLLLMLGAVFVPIICFVVLIVRENRREMQLHAALIKQMEATQQAERKSMKKSNAYANASHDVRASLAGITGLIEMCRGQVAPRSELEASLAQMESCTRDLLGILNSILDTSKIEAGKMQLEEEEFEVAKLLEDVSDLFHSVGMKKGVDVVLDLNDGSVTKFSRVKGDRVKLKQILCNLVSNAVKFTSEGHVSIRSYARKPSFENLVLATSTTWNNRLTCLFQKKGKACNDYETMNVVQQDESRMEFIFEVDDTGKGIPKEKAKSIFEDYVQVKETARGQEGTGLGLGIVQSLVRLMGGEIEIADKGVGEKGTCFKFNTRLSVCEAGNVREYDNESYSSYISGQSSLFHSPKVEASRVVLFIQSEERLKVAKKTLERRGINVYAIMHYELLSSTLRNIKQKLLLFPNNSSGISDVNSIRSDCLSQGISQNSSTRSKEVHLSVLDGIDQAPPTKRRNSIRTTTSFILIVIDTNGGPFRELSRAVAEFRKDLCNICSRVVWIDRPGASNIHSQGLDEDKLPPNDLIIFKPFHGSRLHQLIGILPEFGGITPAANVETLYQFAAGNVTSEASTSRAQMRPPNLPMNSSAQKHGEIGGLSNEKPLNGKKVLVAEDDLVLRKIASSVISKLGAAVELCVNGQEALEIVCKGLTDQRNRGAPDVLPYDFVFMDCEMPIMDGFEATRRIRKEEEHYGVHIPIIAVSAHINGPELRMMVQAGMDHHLPKPLNLTKLMQVLVDISGR